MAHMYTMCLACAKGDLKQIETTLNSFTFRVTTLFISALVVCDIPCL